MPKVGKIRIQIPGFDENPKDYDLYYNQKDNFCIKGVSDSFKKLTDFHSDGYETEIILQQTLREAIEIAKEKLKTQRKVIVFSIAASAELSMNKVGPGNYSGQKVNISQSIKSMNFTDGAALDIDYDILIEIDNKIKKEYYKIKEDGSTGWKTNLSLNDSTVIEWTQDREDFFKYIYKSMSDLLLKLSIFFFSRDINSVLYAIDNKQLKLNP